MGDVALLAVRCGQQQSAAPSDAGAVAAAAAALLRGWVGEAGEGLTQAGVLPPDLSAAVAAQWDWGPMLQQAAQQVTQQQQQQAAGGVGGGGGGQEVRRAMQRQLRQMAQLVRAAQAVAPGCDSHPPSSFTHKL